MIKKILIISILLTLTIGVVSATDNTTNHTYFNKTTIQNMETPLSENNTNPSSQINENTPSRQNTILESNNPTTYYKEKTKLTATLKYINNQPITNKKLSITINNITYNKFTDNQGKILLKLNLKPGTYSASIKFDGDDNHNSKIINSTVKVNKAILKITTQNYKTYYESGFYFKAKIINKITKKPVKGVKVEFKVYSNNKYKIYYALTNDNGIAKLKRNLKVGTYKIITSIKNKHIKAKKTKSNLTIKETAEYGCCSLYLQVSNTESVAGFRRDATNAKQLHIIKYNLHKKSAVKQYKTNSYFFHLITTADGWMIGTGGIDNPDINRAIEDIAGKMAKSGKIQKSYLKQIQNYEQILGLGHFSIKAPNGKYAIVWTGGIYKGKLKSGEYLSAPNDQSSFRQGSWTKLSKNPVKAAIKIAATDSFGVNRRDATAFHWKSQTKEGQTTSTLKVYAANDDGRLVGRSTGHLIDDIRCKGQFISKYSLPNTPNSKFLTKYHFGSIDKLIKTQTIVKTSNLSKKYNESKTFKIIVKDKKSKKPVENLKLKLKFTKKTYTIKTDSKGVARFNHKLKRGIHKVKIYSGNDKYYVSAESMIKII